MTQFFTDQGLVGTTMDGEGALPEGIGRTIQQRAEAYFIGKDPFEIEVHNAAFFQKQKAPPRVYYLELGLWDIIGKAIGQPLYRLWGAASDKVKPYAATVHFNKTPQERAEDALKFYAQGFRAIKLRFHHVDPKDDLALAEAVIRAVGGKMDVMVDANMASSKPGDPPPVWDFDRALYMAKALDEMGLYWLEEPFEPDELDAYAELADTVNIPIAAGEHDATSWGFRELIEHGHLDIVQPDMTRCGGLTDAVKIARLAEQKGVVCMPHAWKSGIVKAASLHLNAVLPGTRLQEYCVAGTPINTALTRQKHPLTDGYVDVPTTPGLGIDLDPEILARFAVPTNG